MTWFIAERLDSTRYVTADLDGRDVDCHEDLQRLTLDDRSFDVVIACDVLEHIPDDCAAIHEVFRVLRPGGAFIVTVPQVLAWKATYEDAAIIAPTERERHFGQRNHLRWYGADFTDRLLTAGFEAEVVDSLPAECAEYALEPGRRAYVAVRPRA